MSLYENSLTKAKKAAREFLKEADRLPAGDVTRGHLDVLAKAATELVGPVQDQQTRNA